MPKKKWMREAFGSGTRKEGALRKQLEIPADKTIPRSLVNRIMASKVGSRIRNPTKVGKRRIRVTGLLKKRTNPVRTAMRCH